MTTAALQDFEKAMDDDLNTAQALAAVFDWVRDLNTELAEGRFLEDDRQTALRHWNSSIKCLSCGDPTTQRSTTRSGA